MVVSWDVVEILKGKNCKVVDINSVAVSEEIVFELNDVVAGVDVINASFGVLSVDWVGLSESTVLVANILTDVTVPVVKSCA